MATAIGTFVSFAVTWHPCTPRGPDGTNGSRWTTHAWLGEEGFAPARRIGQMLDEEKGPRLVFSSLSSQRRQGSQGTGRPHERDALCADDDPVCRNGADAFAPDTLPPWLMDGRVRAMEYTWDAPRTSSRTMSACIRHDAYAFCHLACISLADPLLNFSKS